MAPLVSDSNGLSTAMIGYMMNAMVLGGVLFQYPLGAASDYLGRTRLIGAIAFGCAGVAGVVLVLPDLGTASLMFAMFLFGGTSLTLYALCAADAHDQSTLSRTEASALLLLLNGAGSMIGPVMTGALTIYFEDALFIVAALSMSVLLLIMTLNFLYGTSMSVVSGSGVMLDQGEIHLPEIHLPIVTLVPGPTCADDEFLTA